MAVEFRLPDLGENINDGDVIQLLVAVGDTLAVDQPVLEIETGKATLEVPSTVAGTVASLLIKAGDKVAVGQPVLTIDGEAAAPAANESKPGSEAPSAKPAPSPDATPAPAPPAAVAPVAPAPVAVPRSTGIPVAAAPSVRKFAREIGVAISQVNGTGPKGRISIPDVKAYARQLNEGRAGAPAGTASAPPLPDFSKWGEVEREAMNNVRKMTVQHMTRCWSLIPHVTQNDKADITELEVLRKRFSKRVEQAGGKLTPTAMLLKVVASALKVFPKFNASIDTATNEIILKKYIHIGVAVDTPKGLVVPVLRNADEKNIVELAVELTEIAERVRGGKVTPEDMQGGTFTISNLGGIGGGHFTPIVNHPEVAILGVGRGIQEPVFVDDAFVPRLMLPLSLSYDHRLIDGADGARFLRWIGEAVTEPLLLALEG